MSLTQVLPVLAYAGACLAVLGVALGLRSANTARWLIPAGLASMFLAFSLVTIGREGLVQFWDNHTNNLTGNQVWFDLLLSVGIGFYLLAPRARSVGMRLVPWAIAVVATASIALLPMLARVIWLEQKPQS